MQLNQHFAIVIDTNVYISALGFDNILLKLLNICFESELIQIYISDQIYNEIEEVFFRESFDKKVKNSLSKESKLEFLQNLKLLTVNTKTDQKITICRDPKDNKFLELAQTVKAHYLITGDKDLLDLKQFGGTKILKPSEFILELGLEA